MQTTTLRNLLTQSAFALALALFVLAPFANAGTIPHPMVMGPSVAYTDISETSQDPVPLYGAPVADGDDLAFFEPTSSNPSLGFSAQSSGGNGDLTDGFLNLTIMGKEILVNNVPTTQAISMITFSEGGDYTIDSLGAALGRVSAAMNVFQLNIVEVDGVPLATPISLNDVQQVSIDAVPGSLISGQWDLSSTFNLNQALTDAGESFVLGATKLTARVNNTLSALSQTGSNAGIFKKDFDIEVDTPIDPQGMIPEPTSVVLAAMGLIGMLASRRAS